MVGISFEDPTLFYILIGSLSGVILVVVVLLFLYIRRRNEIGTGKGLEDSLESYYPPSVESKDDENNLLFVFNTITERQQSSPVARQRSTPNSPAAEEYDDFMLRKSSSYLDLIQPKVSTDLISAKDLDLQLYKDEVQQAESQNSGYGRILLTLLYDPNQELLCLLINCGENLQSKNNSSSISPYLKVCLLPDKKRRMHSKTRKGANPTFDEEFVFSVPGSEIGKRILRIAVCDFDRFSRQTIIGYVMLKMEDYKDMLLSKRDSGEFWAELQDNDAMPGVKKGDLLFSLAHLPTAGRMTLAVIQAKELNASASDKDTGVAVKVNLIVNGKVVKSKKTSTNKSQLDAPIFNESFVFEITNELLDRISFILIVYAYSGNGKRVVGKANTGPYMYSTGTGLTQWNDMLMQPRKAVAEWHKLM
ncbi:synaptotagmin-1-like [Clytia hemisphaerica]|uniref:C2 domain-containing protein n=1 Tax=Clytia hemisphaerica TaxID=252671 RepID=A0A7M5V5V2_9CNID|eukprot:TCONS_00046584-protein